MSRFPYIILTTLIALTPRANAVIAIAHSVLKEKKGSNPPAPMKN